MSENHGVVLSAFFDGEEVDPKALGESLEQPDAIELLQEFARMRRMIREDPTRPDEEFCQALRERIAREERRGLFRRRVARGSLAASLLVAAAAGGFSVHVALDRRATGPGRQAAQVSPARPSQPPHAAAAPVSEAPPGKPAAVRVWITGWSEKVL